MNYMVQVYSLALLTWNSKYWNATWLPECMIPWKARFVNDHACKEHHMYQEHMYATCNPQNSSYYENPWQQPMHYMGRYDKIG